MRFRRIAAHDDHGLGVADVVVGVRLGAVAPGVGDAGHRGRVADARLVVGRVRAPEGGELAKQIGGLVGEFGGAQEIHGIRAGFLADIQHLGADLVDRLIPGDLLPFAADELHRIFQSTVALHDLADRGSLGAVRAAVDRAVPARLLARPDAVLHFGSHGAADRAMGADVLADDDRYSGLRRRHGCGLAHRAGNHGGEGREPADREAGALQEGATIHAVRHGGRGGGGLASAGLNGFALRQHGRLTSSASRSRSSGRRPERPAHRAGISRSSRPGRGRRPRRR